MSEGSSGVLSECVLDVLSGCVLDGPNYDPMVPELHHVYCPERSSVFVLTKDVYDRTMRQIDDVRQIENQRMGFGTSINFISDSQGYIKEFENGTLVSDTETTEGGNFFKSICVFNKDLTQVYTDYFGTINVNRSDIIRLDDIPNYNVALECLISWSLEYRTVVAKIYKVVRIAIEHQEVVSKAHWNGGDGKASYRCDISGFDERDDTDPKQLGKGKATTRTSKCGFVTGLTSIFVPDFFSQTVLLPTHNRKFHHIGQEAVCDLIYSDSLRRYLVFDLQPYSNSPYYAHFRRSAESVEGVFYVDLDMQDQIHGFYQHDFFKLIADPFGFLDLAKFAKSLENDRNVYTVPIRDRLGKTNDHRSIQDMDIVTRFEIMSTGDEESQIKAIERIRNNKADLSGGGIVINTSTVCGRNFNGIIFKFTGEHSYKPGTAIVFRASRIVDRDIVLPTFLITKHQPKDMSNGEKPYCTYEDGKFKFQAKFNASLGCYEALDIFGYVPCKTPPPAQKPKLSENGDPIERIYVITAIENPHSRGSQTVLIGGEYVKEI